MENNTAVKQIIEYLQAKIAKLKEKKEEYNSPIMQEMVKSSQHLQIDYLRITTELQANEDNLLAIQKFAPLTQATKTVKKDGKKN